MTAPRPVTFESLGLPTLMLEALAKLGYEEPTPIQREAIPALLAGKDVLGQAATGTGKTAAFALPMLSRIEMGRCKQFETSALVLVPTRELALQVTEAIRKYGAALGVNVIAVYGGEEISRQLKPLKRGVDVVVATPGRAIDHLKRKSLQLSKVEMVVLDEADEMLDMGFAEDLETILDALPEKHQTALFSATMPSRIVKIAERHLTHPTRVSIARQVVAAGEAPKVRQVAYVVPRKFKTVALTRIFQLEHPQSALIFCRTRAEVDELSSVLIAQGEPAAALHGGLDQVQRDRVMKKFKTGDVKFLVATDVAARGLHIENLSHVVNYDVPNSPEAYVHRIGRTGRAGREGVALTLAEPSETRMLQGLERAGGGKIAIQKIPTPEELRGHRLQRTRDAVLEAVKAKVGEAARAWVEEISAELDLKDIAAAAIELLHDAQHGSEKIDDVQIPAWNAAKPGAHKGAPPATERGFQKRSFQKKPEEFRPQHERPKHEGHPAKHEVFRPKQDGHPAKQEGFRPKHDDRPPKHEVFRGKHDDRPPKHDDRPPKHEAFRPKHDGRPPKHDGFRPQRDDGEGKINLWIGAGERAGIRPGDLVGAIANEAQVDSKLIGPIQIRESFSLVGVPRDVADRVIAAMQKSTLRGRKVQVRRDR